MMVLCSGHMSPSLPARPDDQGGLVRREAADMFCVCVRVRFECYWVSSKCSLYPASIDHLCF